MLNSHYIFKPPLAMLPLKLCFPLKEIIAFPNLVNHCITCPVGQPPIHTYLLVSIRHVRFKWLMHHIGNQ